MRYPAAVAGLVWEPLGSAGGFSGANLWRGDGAFALKAWPPGYPRARLETVHRWMRQARECGLAFVPAIVATLDGPTWVEHAGRIWDVTAWAPGEANFRAEPSDAKLAAACVALAKLHRAWANQSTIASTCPAVQRRLDILNGPAPRISPAIVAAARAELAAWVNRPVPVQPCLCDVWHDHVLFTGHAVTGVIDYGAMKLDHPAVDLARLLGDLVGDDPARRRFGLEAYRSAHGPRPIDEAFVALLDRTGVVCAVLYWRQRCEMNAAATQRLARLMARLGEAHTLLSVGFAPPNPL